MKSSRELRLDADHVAVRSACGMDPSALQTSLLFLFAVIMMIGGCAEPDTIAVGSTALAQPSNEARSPARPNILLIVADDLYSAFFRGHRLRSREDGYLYGAGSQSQHHRHGAGRFRNDGGRQHLRRLGRGSDFSRGGRLLSQRTDLSDRARLDEQVVGPRQWPPAGLRGVNPPDCANTVGIQYSKVSNIQGEIKVKEAFVETLIPLVADQSLMRQMT
jgi:hypothetical protein